MDYLGKQPQNQKVMGSKPITQRAGTKYGSAPANQEVTIDAEGTIPAKFERMTPLKQLIQPGNDAENRPVLPEDAANSDSGGGGDYSNPVVNNSVESNNVFGNHGLGESAPYYQGPSAKYNKNPFYHEFDTGLDTDRPKQSQTPQQGLIDSADTGEAPPPVQTVIDVPDDSIDPVSEPKGVISNGNKTGDDVGKFIGPGESRERMRSVKYRTNQQQRLLRQESSEIKRSNIKAIRDRDDISREEKQKLIKAERQSHKDTMRGGREAKRDARRKEMERQARTEKYSYQTMQSSGESPMKMWGVAKQGYGSKSSPSKARSPYKMNGYGNKNK